MGEKKKLVEKKKAEKGKNESVLSEDVLIILLMLEALTFLFCFLKVVVFNSTQSTFVKTIGLPTNDQPPLRPLAERN